MHIAGYYTTNNQNNESLQKNDSMIVFDLFYNINNNKLNHILGNKIEFLLEF